MLNFFVIGSKLNFGIQTTNSFNQLLCIVTLKALAMFSEFSQKINFAQVLIKEPFFLSFGHFFLSSQKNEQDIASSTQGTKVQGA